MAVLTTVFLQLRTLIFKYWVCKVFWKKKSCIYLFLFLLRWPIMKLCFWCQCRGRTLTGKKSVDIWPSLIYTVQHNATWLPSVNVIAQECYVMPSTEVDSLAVAPIVKLCFRCQCRRRTLTGKKSVDIWPALIVYTVQHNTTWLPSVNIIAQECYVVPSTEVDSLAVAPIINWQVILQQQQQTIGQNGNDKLIHKRSNRLESCTYHIKTASLQSLSCKNYCPTESSQKYPTPTY